MVPSYGTLWPLSLVDNDDDDSTTIAFAIVKQLVNRIEPLIRPWFPRFKTNIVNLYLVSLYVLMSKWGMTTLLVVAPMIWAVNHRLLPLPAPLALREINDPMRWSMKKRGVVMVIILLFWSTLQWTVSSWQVPMGMISIIAIFAIVKKQIQPSRNLQ